MYFAKKPIIQLHIIPASTCVYSAYTFLYVRLKPSTYIVFSVKCIELASLKQMFNLSQKLTSQTRVLFKSGLLLQKSIWSQTTKICSFVCYHFNGDPEPYSVSNSLSLFNHAGQRRSQFLLFVHRNSELCKANSFSKRFLFKDMFIILPWREEVLKN